MSFYARVPGTAFTRAQLRTYAYREARAVGFDTNTSNLIADRVLERVALGGETVSIAIEDEIIKAKEEIR